MRWCQSWHTIFTWYSDALSLATNHKHDGKLTSLYSWWSAALYRTSPSVLPPQLYVLHMLKILGFICTKFTMFFFLLKGAFSIKNCLEFRNTDIFHKINLIIKYSNHSYKYHRRTGKRIKDKGSQGAFITKYLKDNWHWEILFVSRFLRV